MSYMSIVHRPSSGRVLEFPSLTTALPTVYRRVLGRIQAQISGGDRMVAVKCGAG